MTDNVHVLNVPTRLDIPVERVLDGARDGALANVVVIGWAESGEFYFSSSLADAAEVVFLCEMAKTKLIRIVEGRDE